MSNSNNQEGGVMKDKHTPGVWTKVGASVVNAETRSTLAVCTGSDTAEVDANARLIAAAPALLEALKSAVETIEWMRFSTAPADDEVEKAIREGNAAIASAKGGV